MISSICVLALLAASSVAAPSSSSRPTSRGIFNGTRRFPSKLGKRCTGTIASLDDVSAAQECTTVIINEFTVDAGETFTLNPADGATVTMAGDVTFAFKVTTR
ncbi:hypothetical protein J3R30DRAFT_948695 [Lentinula aciculospora]|uniref:Uncharacterized protein n=1 Tax=Lentinula aciculospora TaxID=153920 RepID=A0A9W9AS58_9AGAR|nr:hypothetical protein J3R30DRAFT_811183 [Lentinula aciculospora]KAJ4488515.1 hypothetical protein J3R30DRAFT_948695 [Lentinula aciculospora]